MDTVLPDHIVWTWKSQAVRVGANRLGVGPTVLLLPALSSISTRREMRPLQERLASNFTTVAVDWPGFGDEPRPAIRWQPDALCSFSSLHPHRSGASTICNSGCWTRGQLCPCRRCCRSEFHRTAVSDRANMARAFADNDGRKT